MINNSTSYYHSYDLGSCAALATLGYELVSLDRSDPRKVCFIFSRQDGLAAAVDGYWADRLQVKARTYFDNTRMLKQRVHGG